MQITKRTGLPIAACALLVSASAAAQAPAEFFCSFADPSTDCGFREQAKVPGRATLVGIGRDDASALRLTTQPGDSNVYGSGSWERNDFTLITSTSYCNQGQEEWWAHSVYFPDDYTYAFGVVADFHSVTPGNTQANFQLMTTPQGLRITVFGGPINGNRFDQYIPDPYGAIGGSVVKNLWYDFVYHIKWSSGSDGFAEAWLNGKKVLAHAGPTLYSGSACYLKLANYHVPVGQASSLIHDRILRGTSAASVALTTLEGVPAQ